MERLTGAWPFRRGGGKLKACPAEAGIRGSAPLRRRGEISCAFRPKPLAHAGGSACAFDRAATVRERLRPSGQMSSLFCRGSYLCRRTLVGKVSGIGLQPALAAVSKHAQPGYTAIHANPQDMV